MAIVVYVLITLAVSVLAYDASSPLQKAEGYGPNETLPSNGDARTKRDDNLMEKQPLTLKLRIVFDSEAVKLARKHFQESEVTEVLNEMGVTFGNFINDCFKSLEPEVRIRCKITRINIFEERMPAMDRTPHWPWRDGSRSTVCATVMFQEVVEFLSYSEDIDHTLYLTGFKIVAVQQPWESFFSDFGTVCTRRSVSLAEFSFDLNTALRVVARAVMPRPRLCLKEPRHELLKPKTDMGIRMSLDRQCRVVTNMPAVKNQKMDDICSEGIACYGSWVQGILRILPFLGTPCRANDVMKTCRWKTCRF